MRSSLAICVLLVLTACAGTPRPRPDQVQTPAQIPVQLVFDKEISGRLLAYDLNRPSGLAFDALGDLFIADGGNHRLIKLGRNLAPVRDYGGYGSGTGQFSNPGDIAIDRGLNLYVLDGDNRRIIRLDINLNYVDEIIPEDDSNEIISTLGKLSGLQISQLGEISVADYDNSRLIRLDNFNRFSRYVGDFGYGSGALLNPLGLAFDGTGRYYVADAGNRRIAVYDDYGNYLSQFGTGELDRPSAVTVDHTGIIWVADEGLHEIMAYTAAGAFLMRTGGETKYKYQFSDIKALAVSSDNRLFVADTGNNRILIYRIIYEAER